MGAKLVYEDEKGNVHPSAEDAERMNAAYAADKAFYAACNAVNRTLFAGASSADGVPFAGIMSRHMWQVFTPHLSQPQLRQVWVWPHSGCSLHVEDGEVWYTLHDEHGKAIGQVRLSELFFDREKARSKWKTAVAAWRDDVAATANAWLED